MRKPKTPPPMYTWSQITDAAKHWGISAHKTEIRLLTEPYPLELEPQKLTELHIPEL